MGNKENIQTAETGSPAGAPDEVVQKMERRARRSVTAVERRAEHAIKELESRRKEYLELIDDRIDQMKERYFVDRGADRRVTAAQESANVLKKEISAAASKARHDIEDRVKRFKEGVALVRIEVDADILTVGAACGFVDKLQAHSRLAQDRIDGDFDDADASMRRRVNKLEPVF